ncbi:hypothetical protein VB796_17960 [Arcicella sp. LKC2W]|uniref:hypothetical protein n=1 Tax=Arcicella sp. LKC2W TaxID=2984198 RepID=UPI002B1E9F4D|nr:hypothetical protein [Arcicella sp. LKC2W]MEA5460951.1 hypothetical protein [Arcicella sp. LKC2W]
MKNTSSNLWNNLSSKATNNRLVLADIEFITDDFAHQIRGGDKYYTPMYELETNSRTRFFLPSILLEP